MSIPLRSAWASEPVLWDWNKEQIKHLYLHKNMTLKEVAKIMQTKHSFRATTKMYKQHFHKWGFRKNLKACESKILLEARRIPGEASGLPIVHGRELGPRWLKSRVLRPSFTYVGSTGCKTTEDLSVDALPYLVRAIDMPDHLRFADDSLRAAGTYVKAHQNTWNLMYFPNRNTETYLWKDKILYAARQISENQNLASSFMILNKACDEFKVVLQKEEPTIVLLTYSVILQLLRTRIDLAKVFIKFFADYCSIYLGQNHPLSKLWASVMHMDVDDIHRLALPVVDMQFDIFRDEMTCNGLVGARFEAHAAKKLRDLGLISCEVAHARIDNCVQWHPSLEPAVSSQDPVLNKSLFIGILLWKATVHADTQDWTGAGLVLDEVERLINGLDDEMTTDPTTQLQQVSYLEIRSAQLEQHGNKEGARFHIEGALTIAQGLLAEMIPAHVGFCFMATEMFHVRMDNLQRAQAVRSAHAKHRKLIMGGISNHNTQQQDSETWEEACMVTDPQPYSKNPSLG